MKKIDIIQKFIKENVHNAGFEHAVVGLSGGIDSSFACYLTVNALGKENVLGVRMPYKTSSENSLVHAQLVIDKLGIISQTIPITGIVDSFSAIFPNMSLIRKGNIMARLRMIILYDISVSYKGLVIGTGNKTEELLGYTTLFGDSACALNPLGDLYKTEIFQLAKEIGIPDEIISKPPSADLWKDQTDEGELGFTYENVDKLLHLLIDKKYTLEECIANKSFDREFIIKIIKIIKQNVFKRITPLICYLNGTYDFVNEKNWME